MFLLLLTFLLINGNISFRIFEATLTETIIANVTKAIAGRYLTRCIVLLVSDDQTHFERSFNFRIAKILSSASSVVVKTFEQYFDLVKSRYDTHRCSRMLNVVCSSDVTIRRHLEKFPRKIGGPVWLLFLADHATPSELLRRVNITFDAIFITAKVVENFVEMEESYRVSPQHEVRVKPFGMWTPQQGLHSPDHLSPYYRRSDLEGLVLRAGYNEDPPITMCGDVSSGCGNELLGYFGRVWKDLEERLNFSTVFRPSPDKQYGAQVGGRWNGLVGMIVRKEVDVAVAEMTLVWDRMPFVDYLRPIYSTSYQIFFRLPGSSTDWDVLLRPFGSYIWVVLLLWILGVALLLRVFYALGIKYRLEKKTWEREFRSSQVVFIVLSALSQQGNPLVPGSSGCRIVLLTAYLFSIVLASVYSGSLTSYIAVENPLRPFTSFETMLEDGSYSLEQIPGSTGYTYFSNSSDPILRQVHQKLFAKLPEKDLPLTGLQALQRVCHKERVAYFAEYGVTEVAARQLYWDKGCQISVLEQSIGTVYISPIIQKDSPYTRALNHHLYVMHYQGILHKFKSEAWGLREASSQSKFHPISAKQVSPLHFLLLSGVLLSIAVVSLEIFLGRAAGFVFVTT